HTRAGDGRRSDAGAPGPNGSRSATRRAVALDVGESGIGRLRFRSRPAVQTEPARLLPARGEVRRFLERARRRGGHRWFLSLRQAWEEVMEAGEKPLRRAAAALVVGGDAV